MPHRKQINAAVEPTLNEDVISSVDSELIDEYKKLNEKCDDVITKIKKRKSQSKKQK